MRGELSDDVTKFLSVDFTGNERFVVKDSCPDNRAFHDFRRTSREAKSAMLVGMAKRVKESKFCRINLARCREHATRNEDLHAAVRTPPPSFCS